MVLICFVLVECFFIQHVHFSKLEDEESIRYLLDNRPDMHLVDIVSYEGFAKGFISSDEDLKDNMDKCVRIFPHKMSGEGHFVVSFKKRQS